ncbi:Ribulose-phosphate 3-epimerase [Anatilimnocola aggregata]|uniref:Ribulose-phosphate 3-epimerase n=2 Tax=Anatilimnocola aggregata TaxID=2528021 RepID=A0A517Y7X0_9BACT|nr:Ribulose-phosphate 3-epimerase [Anatilimnocola aggregata]
MLLTWRIRAGKIDLFGWQFCGNVGPVIHALWSQEWSAGDKDNVLSETGMAGLPKRTRDFVSQLLAQRLSRGSPEDMSASQSIDSLRGATPLVLPSLLQCDFANLEREVRTLEDAGIRALHLDVMDGNFVPNLSYGMPIVAALRKVTKLPLDVHLMIEKPERYLKQFAEAGSDLITFHVEAVADAQPLVNEIHSLGVKAGIALNPATPLGTLDAYLGAVDLILVMSVPAGFGGQKFHDVALDKLQTLNTQKQTGQLRPEVILEVDGGVNTSTIGRCAQAGAQWFVVGSAIFGQASYRPAVEQLTQLARL